MNMAANFALAIVSLLCFAVSVVPALSETQDCGAAGPGRFGKADPHSYGNPEQVRIQQIELDLTVDFDERRLNGVAILDIARPPERAG